MKPVVAVPADLIEVGFLRGAYGLQGWVHVQPHSGDALVLRGARQWWLRRPSASVTAGSKAGGNAAVNATPNATADAAASAGGNRSGDAAVPVEITGMRAQGAALVAKWHGCDDPESAQSLKGWGIAVSRAGFPRLPQGQYYWVDLVGARVVNRGGAELGVVSGVRSNGAHDLLEVGAVVVAQASVPANAPATPVAMMLIPMVPSYVDDVDLEARVIRVDWEADWS
jgi:16S rRNA processing protein RimM